MFRPWLKTLLAVSTATTLTACSTAAPTAGPDRPATGVTVPALDPAGWTDSVYQKLTETIAASAGQNKIVVFDFDNTTQARDIGEAVLANAQQSRAIDGATLPSAPAIRKSPSID